MANNFRNINFASMLYETLTGFFSVQSDGTIADLYKFCAAFLSLLQTPFTLFDAFRKKEYLIANCKWQIGQLTNVLNFLYDPIQNRITITQSSSTPTFFWKFAYPPSMFFSDFDTAPMVFLETFSSKTATTAVTIDIPSDIPLDDITATIAQISITGIPYKINHV